MFRKILITAVASLSFLSPLALPAQSEAHEVRPIVRHRGCEFRVYFRACPNEPWRFGGDYRCREDAFRAAHRLRDLGFETVVR
jgi:hypothetical protein